METIPLHPSPDQSISPHKQHIRNPGKIQRSFISRPSENFAPSNFYGGLLYTPQPSLSYSFRPSVSFLRPLQHQQHQPPLLPLPISRPYNSSLSQGLSCPPINRKTNNRNTDQSRTPKKSKPSTSPKKEGLKLEYSKSTTPVTKIPPGSLITASTNRLGPDPKELPNDVSRVLSSSSGNSNNTNNGVSTPITTENQDDKLSGSVVFTLSPPPSSLPLPTFSLRPKLSCNSEAAGIDTGATDSLRRLLRLR